MRWLSSLFLVAAVSVASYEIWGKLAQPQVVLHEPRLAALFLFGAGLVLLLVWTLMEEAGWGFLLVNLGMLGELGFLISSYRMVQGELVIDVNDRFILAAVGVLVFSLLNLFLIYLEFNRGKLEASSRAMERPAQAPATSSPSQKTTSPPEEAIDLSTAEVGAAGEGTENLAESTAGKSDKFPEQELVKRGLAVVKGDQAGSFIPLEGSGPWRLGRETGLEVVIPDPQVSRLHAELTLTPLGLEIRDLGSTNGTFINGTRLSERKLLVDGDLIEVGETGLRVVFPQKPDDS